VYDLVYIYEFEGNVSSRIPLVKADEDYIGFWKEANYSFLFFKKEKKALLQKHFPPYRSELVIRHEDWESGNSLDILRVEDSSSTRHGNIPTAMRESRFVSIREWPSVRGTTPAPRVV